MALSIFGFVFALMAADPWRVFNDQGNQLREQGSCREAVPLLMRARSVALETLGPRHPYNGIPISNLASAYLCLGESTRAERHFREALALAASAETRDLHAGILNNLAILLIDQNRPKEAAELLNEAITANHAIYGGDHPQTGAAITSLGVLRLKAGQHREAAGLFRRALHIYEVSLGPEHLHTAATLNNLGAATLYLGDYRLAMALTARALAVRRRYLPADHPDIAQSLHNYGVSLEKQGNRKAARYYLRQARAIHQTFASSNSVGITVDARALKAR